MAGKPSLQFYPGDWFKSEDVRQCSPTTRGIWIDLILYAFNRQSYGEMRGTIEGLARLCGSTTEEMETAVEELDVTGTADVEIDSNGIVSIVCRRLRDEQEEREGNAEYMREYRARKRAEENDSNPPVGERNSDVNDMKDECTSRSRTEGEVEVEEDSSKGREGKNVSSRARDIPNYDEVMESWNSFAGQVGIPQIRKMTKDRRAAVRQRGKEVWPLIEEIYDEIRGSPFLLGQEGRESWNGVTFDFVWCQQKGALKILEGNYRGSSKNNDRAKETRSEAFDRLVRATGGT